MSKLIKPLIISLIFTLSSIVSADAIDELLLTYQNQGASNFSSASGQSIWTKQHQNRSCTSCHTSSVKNTGKHQRTGKVIKPMAPSINPTRLKDKKKIKKWFIRNCKWTFKRECSPQEKGDILTWLRRT